MAEFDAVLNLSVASFVAQYPMIYGLELNSTIYIEPPEDYLEVCGL